MVAMNPQTWDKDVAGIEPGGYLFYDSTKPMPASKFRDDITVIGVPLTAICNRDYTDPRQRQLFKNIIYVGALSALLDMDVAGDREADRRAVQGQGQADRSPTSRRCTSAATTRWRTSTARSALRAARAPTRSATASSSRATGRRARRASMAAPRSAPGIRSRRRPRWPRPSPATASGYRVDPETGKNRYAIVQAEDELASIGMVIGAAWNGARAFTATSGPGHLADAGVHRPGLFRRDPGGDLRRPARRPVDRHADAHPAVPTCSACAYASHGDTKHVLLFPEDPAEASSSARRPSISPTGCRRRSSSCSISTSA